MVFLNKILWREKKKSFIQNFLPGRNVKTLPTCNFWQKKWCKTVEIVPVIYFILGTHLLGFISMCLIENHNSVLFLTCKIKWPVRLAYDRSFFHVVLLCGSFVVWLKWILCFFFLCSPPFNIHFWPTDSELATKFAMVVRSWGRPIGWGVVGRPSQILVALGQKYNHGEIFVL